jgi:hydroxyacylglutathione hydrolase
METLRKEEGVGVLDVRRLTEYQGVHVEGAYNIAHTRLLARKGELEKGKVWLVHCRTGARSAPASALLARFGYDVRYVNGEFSRWMAAHGEAIEESMA